MPDGARIRSRSRITCETQSTNDDFAQQKSTSSNRTKMHFHQALFGLGLAATTASAAQPLLYVKNQCPENVYVVYSNDQYKAAQVTLTQGKGFQVILSGLGKHTFIAYSIAPIALTSFAPGYSVGLSTDPNFYSEAVAKLIFGYSVNSDNHLLYYSVAADYGNPFQGQSFSLTGSTGCSAVNSPNGVTYACADTSSLSMVLCG